MTVSVIIAVFNGEATVARALDSVLAQNFAGGLEIVVVDDGSIDSTASVLARYREQIRVLRQENRGAAAARNAGAAIATGELLAFLDADDIWTPDMLATMVAALAKRPDAVLAYCDAIGVGPDGAVIAQTMTPAKRDRAPTMADLLTNWWPILPSAVVMRKGIFNACGGFRVDLRAYEDPFLWLLARERGSFEHVAQPLVYYSTVPTAQRMAKYEPYHELFVKRVRERYGRAARKLVRNTHRAFVSAFAHEGMMAMRNGDMAAARRDFIRALRHAPFDVRTALRFLRTYLPRSFARCLSGAHHDDA